MSDTAEPSSEVAEKKPNSRRPMIILAVASVVSLIGLWFYTNYEDAHPSTSDAYVNADILRLAPQVSGQVTEVYVDNNQYVTAGTIIAKLDSKPFQIAVDAARANLDASLHASSAGSAGVSAAAATVRQRQAGLNDASLSLSRAQSLVKSGAISKASLDQASAAYNEAKAQFDTAQAQLAQATSSLGGTGTDNDQVRVASAQVQQAELNLAYTTVEAPVDGWIANFSLRPGQVVQMGQPLGAIVSDERWWIDANFKETQLRRIRPGQPATITLDMYPGLKLEGEVVSLPAGSGSAFSFLPAQNATGNWVKVTQRFAVRVRVNNPDKDPQRMLRVGASSKVRINTKAAVPQDRQAP